MVSGGGPGLRKAVFLDRDGVLVVPEFRDGRSFAPRRLEDFHLYPAAPAALAKLKAAGFLLFVVTNQPDVGHGLVAQAVVESMHKRLREALPLDAIKSCFHRQNENCRCRKPQPGMILDLASEFGISLSESFMVGDRSSDVAAGRAAGCKTIFIDLGYRSEPKPDFATYTVRTIDEAADVVITTSSTQ